MGALRQFPIVVVLLLIISAAMLVPAAQAMAIGEWAVARSFFYHGIFFGIVGIILGTATMNSKPRMAARYHLLSLLSTYMLLPIVLATPLVSIIPNFTFSHLYFEMLSCLTTTGATIFERPSLIPGPVHLWRAMVGWFGGLMVLVTAFAILAPLNLGGFEISQNTLALRSGGIGASLSEGNRRIRQYAGMIAPVYALLTGLLAFILILLGDRPLTALCHAMSTMSTSGISPLPRLEAAGSGRLGEIAIACFLLFAISHKGLNAQILRFKRPKLSSPQVQLMLISVFSVTLILFLRSFIGAVEIDRQGQLDSAVSALWGSVFTVLSFLTTTGFESHDWRTMQIWSGLPDPGAILLGVAVMGGGIATTAGGVKLLRLYALYRHGLREMDKLVHPSSLGRHGEGDQLISDDGPKIAFVFLMLFLVALAFIMIALSATGLGFNESLTFSVASLTTTGPVIQTGEGQYGYTDLNAAGRLIFGLGMIVGRMETLVVIALFNPSFWRS
ncbi:TrkH family potassium uptake protein [Amaricoccus macauensis]|uniref:TrkH family potassium uptake protein n=1 Tax=Amaricoccus macauensis TaxID=57001 RepID=UPI003C7A6D1B